MKTITIFDDFINSNEVKTIAIEESKLRELDCKIKELKEEYALKANDSLISASNVFLNN